MKRILYTILLSACAATVLAQSSKEQQAIKSLCGCFEIEFKYAETFSSDSNYKQHEPYTASALEWVNMEESSDKKYVMQHLLLVTDQMIIKHWREDWEYEKSNWWQFKGKGNWLHTAQTTPAVKGQWTQTVWEVDDAPRYQGTSKWIDNDGKYYWENTVDAPLPRREYTHRSDYNILKRKNRIVVNDGGWVHEQDNIKILREDTKDKIVAEEKGYNTYKKVADSKCEKAAAWWKEHKEFWAVARETWDEALSSKKNFTLLPKVDDKSIAEQFTALEKQNIPQSELKGRLLEVLQKYMQ